MSIWNMRRIFSLGVVLALTFLLFLPTVRYALVYDDIEQIATNPRITSWSYVPQYFTTHLWAHSTIEPAYYYRPLFLIWLRLVDAILGPPAPIWHLASIVAHLAATISVFLLVHRLTGCWRASLFATALFSIHPIHTEAVAWVSSVSEPLLTALLVLCVYCYAGRKPPISVASLLFAALAMFTKETGMVAPLLILAYEWTRSTFKNAATAAAPYLLPALLFLALRFNALGRLNAATQPNMTVSAMVLTWPRVLVAYLAHLLWPVHLSVCYDVPVETAIWPFLVMLTILGGLISVAPKWSANVRLGVAWFVITLLPALAIRYLLTDDYVHDRYLYLPSVGLALIAAVWFSRLRFTPPRIVAAGVLAMALCWGTILDLRIWKDEISLFSRAVEVAPGNVYAMNNLASAYLNAHREAEALPLLQKVIALRPLDHQGYYNMFRYYQQTGNYAEAERYYNICRQMYDASQSAGRAR